MSEGNGRRPSPEGWKWMRLGDVAQYLNGHPFKPEEWSTEGTPIIRIQNLNSPSAPFNYYQGEVDPTNAVEHGDLLVSWSASLDAYIWNRGTAVLNQHIFKVIENIDLVTREYLYFSIRHAMEEIRDQVHGATMRHITKPEFEKICIPVPPIPEQQRLGGMLRDEMATLERALAAAETQLAAIERLSQARVRALFQSTDAASWTVRPLSDLCTDSGQYGTSEKTSYDASATPVLRMGNIRNGEIDWRNLQYLGMSGEDLNKYRLMRGDLLFNRTNSAELVGKTAVFDGSRSAVCASYLIRFRLRPETANPDFISTYINSGMGRAYVRANMGRAIGQVNISASTMLKMPIPTPGIEKQRAIAESLTRWSAGLKSLKASVSERLAAIEKVQSSLLTRAFSGQV